MADETGASLIVWEIVLQSEELACSGWLVRRLTGREAISELYQFEVELAAPDDATEAPDVSEMLGANVQLGFMGKDGTELRTVHGMVSQARLRSDDRQRRPVVSLSVVPRAWRLSLFSTQEIFLAHSVPEVVEQKLERLELADYATQNLTADYPTREHVIQYKESDLQFVSRLCEHLGISYFFEQADEGDKMVFSDHQAAWPALEGTVPYRSGGDEIGVFELTTVASATPAVYAVHDYNYRTPDLVLSSVQPVEDGLSGGVVEYGSHHKTPEEGQALAEVRSEELACRRVVHEGTSAVGTLGAGMTFELSGHARLEGSSLLVTRIEHDFRRTVSGGEDERGYSNRFTAVPTETTFRPLRRTPVPRIYGIVSAMVQPGSEGETGGIPRIDEDGRYRIRCHFDTSPIGEQPTSQMVRMAQPFVGGGRHGMHFPLERGTEVLLAFVDGNPDRPIILSAVPNAANPATVTAHDAELNKIQTERGVVIQFGRGPTS